MKVGLKIWIDHHGKAFGDGPYELLKRVEKTRSLHQAAIQMKMSYSKAWRILQTIEKRLGIPLLYRKIGGEGGGGSQLTPEARVLIARYEPFQKEAKRAVEKIFLRHFRSLPRKKTRWTDGG